MKINVLSYCNIICNTNLLKGVKFRVGVKKDCSYFVF